MKIGLLKKNKAFTLAEVLITLGIIGVVASMTIPTLMNNIQDNEFKTKMRKEYSLLSQAQQLLATENGGNFSDAVGIACQTAGDWSCFKNMFRSKLSFIKECDSSTDVCLPPKSIVKYLNGTINQSAISASIWGLVLKDGTAMNFFLNSVACNSNAGSYTNDCGWVMVDVNGLQPPNTWGRDIFWFYIFSDVIRPKTVEIQGADDCGVGTNYGYTCAAKYLLGN